MYDPSLHFPLEKSMGIESKPVDARSYFYDETLAVYRPYLNIDEVFDYLNTGDARTGQFPIIVNTGGYVLDGNVYEGVNKEYWFKDGISNCELIEKAEAAYKSNTDDYNNWQFNGYGLSYSGNGVGNYAEGILECRDGVVYNVFRSATDSTLDNSGQIVLRISTDSIKTFTAPVTIFNGTYDDRYISGGFVGDTGRFVVFIRQYNYLIPAEVDFGFIYSDDLTTAGTDATWSAFQSVAPSIVPLGTVGYGKIISVNAKYILATYTGNRKAQLLESADGATWTLGATMYDYTTSLARKVTEPSIVAIGNNYLLCIARNDDNGPYYQYESIDGGTTWVFTGLTNTYSESVAVRSACPVLLYNAEREELILFGTARGGTTAKRNNDRMQVYVNFKYEVFGIANGWTLREQVTRPFNNNRNFYNQPCVAFLNANTIVGFSTDGEYSSPSTDLNKERMFLYGFNYTYSLLNTINKTAVPEGIYTEVWNAKNNAFQLKTLQQPFAVEPVNGNVYLSNPGTLVLNGGVNALTNESIAIYSSNLATKIFSVTGNGNILTPNLPAGTVASGSIVVTNTTTKNLQLVPFATAFTNVALTGIPTAPTAPVTTNTTQIATTANVMSHFLTATATLAFPATAAQTSSELTITVNGAVDGDVVSVGVPNAASNANSCFTARVSAANTVSVKFNNYSSAAITPASATFKVTVFK
ncbi:sialidase family protein [Mucilaginibacter phyllosphaerae]|uniref:Exo-alpha-sialidase n=1 Tax=Mucilaginibacter phyllosphaerae TaxID=1812349 RepID=A0A4Y8AAX8_9SPHI|nr:sialidase family protein [Mucilaginibacter phyllosphaerae]MBB3969602.1 hypothetical protein [Mucilaginibacter phyllosphaerae]TEW64991.1 exo-alpha-sialidase [Mucilaginibacter phyllosphaerae]GGH18668.1 hypothetical protein GCM10007352_29540 [Mucilaginibacter phyllosphaerae]